MQDIFGHIIRGKRANDHYYGKQATSKWYHLSSPIEVLKKCQKLYIQDSF